MEFVEGDDFVTLPLSPTHSNAEACDPGTGTDLIFGNTMNCITFKWGPSGQNKVFLIEDAQFENVPVSNANVVL